MHRLIATALALLAMLLAAGAAQAVPVPSGARKVVNPASGMALSVYGAAAPGAQVVTNPYRGKLSQKWYFVSLGNGYHQVRNAAGSDLCIVRDYGSGDRLELDSCAAAGWRSSLRVHYGSAPGTYAILEDYGYTRRRTAARTASSGSTARGCGTRLGCRSER